MLICCRTNDISIIILIVPFIFREEREGKKPENNSINAENEETLQIPIGIVSCEKNE